MKAKFKGMNNLQVEAITEVNEESALKSVDRTDEE
jgi:hypothetical protein